MVKSRVRAGVLVAVVVMLLIGLAPVAPNAPIARAATPADAAAGASTVRALGAGSRIPWQGQDWYFHGANVPWINWQRDFGGGAGDGVSNPENRSLMGSRLEMAKANGVNVIRWWTFEGDAWQIKRDGSGMPTGLDDSIYADFDAALELAEQHDIYYVFVLFSAPTHLPRTWLDDPAQRAQLANVLGPLFARYKDNPRLMTWEVFNEPEFDVWKKLTDEGSMRESVRSIAASVHANSTSYVTVGGAMLDGLTMLKGLGLDYYQAHWYDYMEAGDWCALCTNYEFVQKKYDLDAPLVIGEMYAGTDVENAHIRLEDFYTKGYAGAWVWAGLFPERTADKLGVDWNAMRIFAGRHADIGPRTTEALPPSDAPTTMKLQFTSFAQAGMPRAARGQKMPVDVKVTSTTASMALVDIEIYSPSGEKVHQQAYDGQTFGPGATKVYSTVWSVPPDAVPGEYTVKVGVFTPGWGRVYDWNDKAATFTVNP
jgi:hypothetical protein